MPADKKILENAEIIGTSLWLTKEQTVIIADLHLGMEELYASQGILIPRANYEKIFRQLNEIFKKTGRLERIVVCGDLKHEFGSISEQEWKEVTNILAYLRAHADEVIIVKGNHDKIIGPIASFSKIKMLDFYYNEGNKIMAMHGDKLTEFVGRKEFSDAKILIIGHEHPAVSLKEKNKVEKYKCFLKGKFGNKILIVLPSMCTLAEGTDILKENMLSPFLKQDLSEFECWLVADKEYYFGKLKEIN